MNSIMFGNPFGSNRATGARDRSPTDHRADGKLPAILDFKRSPAIDLPQLLQQPKPQATQTSLSFDASAALGQESSLKSHDSYSPTSRPAPAEEAQMSPQHAPKMHPKMPTSAVPMSFPQKLMRLLDDEKNAEIISWLPHGKAFLIFQKKRFETELMPTLFKQSKFTSFTRKLNRWGFQRIRKGPEAGAYYHKFFKRGQPRLSMQMCCQKPPNEQEEEASKTMESPRKLMKMPGMTNQRNPMLQQQQQLSQMNMEPGSQFLNATAKRQQILNSLAMAQKEMESLQMSAASSAGDDMSFPSFGMDQPVTPEEQQMMMLKRQQAMLMQQQKQQMQLQQMQQQQQQQQQMHQMPFASDNEADMAPEDFGDQGPNSVAYLAAQNAMMRRKMMEQNALMRKTMAELYRNQQKLLQKAATTGGSAGGGGGGGSRGSMTRTPPSFGGGGMGGGEFSPPAASAASQNYGMYDMTGSQSPGNDEADIMRQMQYLQAQLNSVNERGNLSGGGGDGGGPGGTRRAHAA